MFLGGANVLLSYVVRQQQNHTHELQQQYQRVEVINAVVSTINSYRFTLSELNAAMLVKNEAGRSNALQTLAKRRESLDVRLKELADFDAHCAETIRTALVGLPENMQTAVEHYLNIRFDVAAEYLAKYQAGLVSIETALATATAREVEAARSAQILENARTASSLRLSLIIVAVAAGSGLLFGLLVLRSIINPLNATVGAMRQVNVGDTTVDLPPISEDEFGDMAVALRQFRDQADHLRHLAYTDPLTALGSRAKLDDVMHHEISGREQTRAPMALMFMDLDNFSSINDSLGHRLGDRYLCEAAERLNRFVPLGALVCRYSGDKFTVLLDDLPQRTLEEQQEYLRGAAETLLRGLSEPCSLGGHLLPMSASIGISQFPQDATTPELLVSSADAAMYRAKESGRNTFQFSSPTLAKDAQKRLNLIADIRRGLADDEFEPFYQPIVDVNLRRVAGAEALLRWRHPELGLTMPAVFIPVAEESGLIQALGERCLRRASEQAGTWRMSGKKLRISVNLSARQIEDRKILDILRTLKGKGGERSEDTVDFEITESGVLDKLDHAEATLTQLRDMGYRLSVDDFGTGYSSLVYVQRFPIDKIKIDRSFVAKMDSSREARAIISAIIALAKSLDMDVVAEGIETIEQSSQLQEMGCKLQQGFYFTKALAASDFEAWSADYERPAVAA